MHFDVDPVVREIARRGNLWLEYDDPERGAGTWLPASVELEQNDSDGAVVVLRPQGVLPNNAEVRVIVEPTLADIAGESNAGDPAFDRVFGTFRTDSAYEQQWNGIVDSFVDDRGIDRGAVFAEPMAEIGPGYVKAAFDFEGAETTVDYAPTSLETVLDTSFTQIVPVTGLPQNVSGGVFRFRNVTIPQGAIVRGVGPNPMVFVCTGDVRVRGLGCRCAAATASAPTPWRRRTTRRAAASRAAPAATAATVHEQRRPPARSAASATARGRCYTAAAAAADCPAWRSARRATAAARAVAAGPSRRRAIRGIAPRRRRRTCSRSVSGAAATTQRSRGFADRGAARQRARRRGSRVHRLAGRQRPLRRRDRPRSPVRIPANSTCRSAAAAAAAAATTPTTSTATQIRRSPTTRATAAVATQRRRRADRQGARRDRGHGTDRIVADGSYGGGGAQAEFLQPRRRRWRRRRRRMVILMSSRRIVLHAHGTPRARWLYSQNDYDFCVSADGSVCRTGTFGGPAVAGKYPAGRAARSWPRTTTPIRSAASAAWASCS
ncbi:MAG: hypothetical protein U1E73_03510 [Planctomycetota bacterium]